MEPTLVEKKTNNDNLTDITITGVGWTTIAQISRQAVQFIFSIVLARLLTPEDYGLVGMIMVFSGFIMLISDFGFGAALVQENQIEERHYSSIFWINLMAGIVLTSIVVALAPLIATFYHEPKLIPLTRLIALSFMITPLTTVQLAILYRKMDFRLIALIEVTSAIVAGGIAIVLALIGFGASSLIWQVLINYMTMSIALWWLTSWRPLKIFNFNAINELLSFSSNLLGFNVLNYWVRNGDNLLVGKYFGTTPLGIYSRAYTIMLLPVSQVTSVLGRVMFPALSSIQEDKTRVKRIYLRSISMISLVTFPMMSGLFITADHFVITIFGAQWQAVIPVLRILSLLGLVQSIGTTVGWIYQSQGHTEWMFRWGVISGLVLIASFFIGIKLGSITAVAASYTIASGLILLYPSFTIPGKLINMSFWEVIKSILPELACAMFMAIIIGVVRFLFPLTWSNSTSLVAEVILGVITYGSMIIYFNVPAYTDLKMLVTELKQKKFFITVNKT